MLDATWSAKEEDVIRQEVRSDVRSEDRISAEEEHRGMFTG